MSSTGLINIFGWELDKDHIIEHVALIKDIWKELLEARQQMSAQFRILGLDNLIF